jgi:histidinol-phosphate/aromatic aminotransferase/cobyric acid decarboxylase-like protein
LSQFKNKQLVILHSFSKYLGLSHLRVGFALYSNLKTAKEIQPHLPLGLGIEGAIKAIKYIIEQGEMKPSDLIVSNIIKNKEILSEFCSHGNGFSITDFVANYCLLILPKHLKSQKVVDDLNKEGIYVMDGNDFPEPIEGIIRIHTGGKPEFMQQTVNVLKSLYF